MLTPQFAVYISASVVRMGSTDTPSMSDLSENSLDRRGPRAAFTFVLFLGMAFSTIVAFAIPALAPFLIDEMGLLRSQIGSFTSAFYLVGTVGSIPAGRFVDARDARDVLVVTFVISSLTLAATAIAPAYFWMLIAVGCAGTLNATCNPVTNKLIVQNIAPGGRGWVTGIKQGGVQIAAFAAAALLPTLATEIGWRAALAVTAAIPLLGVAVTFALVPRDPRRVDRSRLRGAGPGRLPAIGWLAVYAFLMGAAVSCVFSYLPLYAHEALGLTPPSAGAATSLVGLTAAASGMLWARASERFGHTSTALVLIGAFSLVPMILLLAAPDIASWLVFPAAVAFGGTAAAWNATGMLAVMSQAGPEHAGQASGLVLTGFFGGFILTPLLFGYSVDLTDTYAWGWSFLTLALAGSIGAATLWRRRSFGGA